MARRKRCLGVDLGSHSVKVAELVVERSGIRIQRLVQAPIEIESGATPVERQAAIAKTLRALLRANRISTKEAVFAMPGQLAFVRRFRLPVTTPERLDRIIRYEARQQIPFPLERTQLEYEVHSLPEGGEVEVVLVAVRHDQIRDFLELVGRTGLKAVHIAISPFALFNYFAALQAKPAGVSADKKAKGKSGMKGGKFALTLPFGKKKKAAEGANEDSIGGEGAVDEGDGEEMPVYEEVKAYLHVGAGQLDLAIVRQGKVVSLGFTRSVPIGGNEISRTIQDRCQLGSFADAEKVKEHNTRLMTFDFDPELAGEEFNLTACQAATASVDRMIADVRRSLDFYISQPDGMAVDSIVVSGGTSKIGGLPEYFEEKLGLSVARIDLPSGEGLKLGPNVLPEGGESDYPLFPVAIGLAIQGLEAGRISVDFLPREKKVIRDFPYRRAAVMVAILGGVLVFASQAGSNFSRVYDQQREQIEDILVSRKQQDDDANKADRDRQEVAKLFEDLAPTLGPRDFWLRFLAKVQEVKPAEALIDTIILDEDGQVKIIGVAERENSAADFTRRLQDTVKEPLRAPQLQDVRRTAYPGFDRDVYKFEISFQIPVLSNRFTPMGTAKPQRAPLPGQPGAPGMVPNPYGMPANPYGGMPMGQK